MGWDVVSWWRKCARAACVDEGARELLLLAPLPPGPLLESPLLSVPRRLVRPRFVPYDSILEKQSNSPKECHISGESIHPMSFPCGPFSLTSLPLPLCMPTLECETVCLARAAQQQAVSCQAGLDYSTTQAGLRNVEGL